MSSLSQILPTQSTPFVHRDTKAIYPVSSPGRATYSSREPSTTSANNSSAFSATLLAPPPPAVTRAPSSRKGSGLFEANDATSSASTRGGGYAVNPGFAPKNDDGIIRKGRGLFRADDEDDELFTTQNGRGQFKADTEDVTGNAERRRVIDLTFINHAVQAAAVAPTAHRMATRGPDYATAPRTPDPSVVRKGRGQFRADTVDSADINDYNHSIAIKGRGQYRADSYMFSSFH